MDLCMFGYRRHSALRTIRGGITFGLDLIRLVPPKLRLLGYQRTVKSWGLSTVASFFSLPNIVKSSFADLSNYCFYAIGKKDAPLYVLFARIIGRFPVSLDVWCTVHTRFF